MRPPSSETSNYSVIFLRHAESVGNAEGYYQGQADFPLTERGQAQAKALGTYWLEKKKSFDAAISSPLARARQTAEIITQSLEIPLEFDPIWMERDNGILAGMHHLEAEERYPRPSFIPPFQPIGRTGESQWALFLRAGEAVNKLLQRRPGRYLVVSHGGLLNMVMYVILGLTPQANFQGARFRWRNTAYAEVIYQPTSHTWLVEAINARSHWLEDDE